MDPAAVDGVGRVNPAYVSVVSVAADKDDSHRTVGTHPPPPYSTGIETGAPVLLVEPSDDSMLGKGQRQLYVIIDRNRSVLKTVVVVTLWLLCLAYVLYGLVLDWRRATGVLVIFLLVTAGLFYYFVIKRFGQQHIDRAVSTSEKRINQLCSRPVVKYLSVAAVLMLLMTFLIIDTWNERRRLMSGVGLIILLALTFICSKHPSKVQWRPVIWGLILQFVMGLLVLRWGPGQKALNWMAQQINTFLEYTDAGSGFVYGFLVTPPNICGANSPIFAFKVLSTVIFFSSAISILYYLGIMQFLVKNVAALMQITMGTTAAETMSVAGNIFVGQTEAPLMIKPYLPVLTKSELCAIMTGGFATIAGTVFKVYVEFGACGNHILSASVMSAPASLAISKLFYPETEESKTKETKDLDLGKGEEKNVIEAAANGASNGIHLVANICANLIAFLAFLKFANSVVSYLGIIVGIPGLTFEVILSYLFFPLAYILGSSWDVDEALRVSELIGIKTFVNEFVAYGKMHELLNEGLLSSRAHLIAIYALCGFSNFTAVGIQLGGIGAMCPERKGDLAQVAMRALIAGSIACFMTAAVAGLLSDEVLECVQSTALTRANCTMIP